MEFPKGNEEALIITAYLGGAGCERAGNKTERDKLTVRLTTHRWFAAVYDKHTKELVGLLKVKDGAPMDNFISSPSDLEKLEKKPDGRWNAPSVPWKSVEEFIPSQLPDD